MTSTAVWQWWLAFLSRTGLEQWLYFLDKTYQAIDMALPRWSNHTRIIELLGKILPRIHYTTLTTIAMAQQESLDRAAMHPGSQPYSKDELVNIIMESLDKSTEEETLEFHEVDISTAWQTIDELERREGPRLHRYGLPSRIQIRAHTDEQDHLRLTSKDPQACHTAVHNTRQPLHLVHSPNHAESIFDCQGEDGSTHFCVTQ